MKFKILLKSLLLIAIICPFSGYTQSAKKLKDNWQNLDLKTDSVFGISTEKAYNELLKGKKHVTVVVAVLDVGIDINHEDLKSVIWTNPKEIAGNNKDDDKNGYADDIHGWNFIGGPKGDIEYETEEYVRLIRRDKAKYENADSTKLSPPELVKYRNYRRMKAKLAFELADKRDYINWRDSVDKVVDTLLMDLKTPNPSVDDLKKYKPKNAGLKQIVNYYIRTFKGDNFKAFVKQDLDKSMAADSAYVMPYLKYRLNIDYNPRYMVGDDENNDNERYYGNNHVDAPDADHGTHVAGIIGAVRDNNLGIQGIANDVRIMSVRTAPQGDERDKDVANAIRYAADNGAKVINMSFGKDDPQNKKVVDDAVKYAVSKDVVIVHAAGNDNTDKDKIPFYPNKNYADGSGSASTWIEVGATHAGNDSTLKASFSSYGKTMVDVFAPGMYIKSSIAGSKYDVYSGTSMASPMVAGLAALIRSYYPKLTAVQVKEIILKSVVKVNHDVVVQGKKEKAPFADLCITGGIANAYNALKLAATY